MEPLPDGREVRIADLGPLTWREAEALVWTAEGKTAWEAGTILGIAESTTVQHLASAAGKLRASNRAHLITRAFVLGILAVRRGVVAAIVAASLLAGSVTTDLQVDKGRPPGGLRVRRREDEV